ncbi:MAG: Peptidylprolyl isomerase [Cyanobacteriota bacterium erpe_2018_sw_39hr_WHONDRS-SW48-000098_B_bin.30]|nr:Peptidylprolyl isomerase [Cyanobacteriota bacterium erpe_2018_sw_39hr_WHONDRS-SW48-000098_B_bin.30]
MTNDRQTAQNNGSLIIKSTPKALALHLVPLALSLILAGCSNTTETAKTPDGNPDKATSGAPDTTKAASTSTGTDVEGAKTTTDTDSATTTPVSSDLSQVSAQTLSKLPESLVICMVDNAPVTVAQFKREYREAIVSLQTLLTLQPEKVQEFVAQAKDKTIVLTAEEKARLLETAKKPQALDGKSLDAYLKEKHLTKAQFDNQVMNLGLAFKTGATLIEEQLLTELINRELIMAEAKKLGYYRPAYNRYLKIKETPRFKKALESAEQTPEEVKEDLVQGEMMRMVLEKIAKENGMSEQKLFDFYQKNKAQFKHGEKIRLAHIIIAFPSVDTPPLESVKSQLKKQNPKLSDTEIEQEVLVVKQQKIRLAQELIDRAKKGEDFKSLADNYTEDMQARQAKNGVELGYIDVTAGESIGKDQKALLEAVKSLKTGEVASKPIETIFGYHVVKVLDKKTAGTFTFEELKEPLQQQFIAQHMDKIKNDWLLKRRKEAQIKVTDEFKAAVNKTASQTQPNVK